MKITYKFIIFVLLLGVVSCESSFLEEIHPTRESSDIFFTNDEEAKEAVISLYGWVGDSYGRWVDKWVPSFDMLRGDNLTLPKTFHNNTIVQWLTLNYNPETSNVRDAWSENYEIVYLSNWVIANVEGNENISESVRNEVLAQAYFMRGFGYFNLTRLFEEVPILLEPTTSETYYPEKSSNEECWVQVDNDFQRSLDLDIEDPAPNYVDGRINSGVVNAMIARSYLYRTRPGSNQYWDKVKQYTEAVEDMNVYSLEPIEDFARLFVYTKEDTWVKNSEVIWVAGFRYGPTYGGTPFVYDNQTRITNITQPFGYSATTIQNDVGDTYIMANGIVKGWARYALSQPISDVMIDYMSLGDKRTQEFLYYPTFNDYQLEDLEDPTSVALKETIDADALYQKIKETDGAQGEYIHLKKFQIKEFIGTNIWDGGFHHALMYPLIRYADILLMRAEAEYHLGNENIAKEYLKMITDRAGFEFDYVDQFSGQNLLDEILKQRNVELVLEGLRVPDLIRLDKFKPPYVGTYQGSVPFEEKLKVLPIPQRELDLNQNLVQHELWR